MLESKSDVLKSLVAMRKALKSIGKETAQGVNYKILKYDTLVDELQDLSLEHGLSLVPEKCHQTNCTPYERTGNNGKNIHVNCDSYVFTFKLWHVSGEFIDVSVPSIGIDDQDKGPGKAITYAAKNAWEKLLMLKRGDDNDIDTRQSQQHQKAPQQQAQAQQQQQPKPRTPSVLTKDRKTWPQSWQEIFTHCYKNAQDVGAIDSDDGFNWINQVTKVKEEIMSKSPPPIILDEILSWYTVAMIGASLKTRHKNMVLVSVLGNYDVFTHYAGKEEAARRLPRLEQMRDEIDPNENPF